ncbi:MAG: transcription elongation factor GreA [Prevotellaceae bacterium]|jgi:transcription elongation factor GreA|nr:transcription elongation factor GreA [Prevotellaceae bacterium]
MAVVYMTEDGYKKLAEQIVKMESVDRKAISTQIAEARDKGDLSENAEYDAAKEAQGMLEMKISQMKKNLADARIIDESKLKSDTVQILCKVKVKNLDNDQEMNYMLVSENEANIREGKLAINTPIGKGLLGKKAGEITEITVPAGVLKFKILNISL